MTTLKDIARHLNLSVTQVSRALNGHSDVSTATQERVRQAARELNYHPNVSARKLVAGRSGIVALVIFRPELPEHEAHFVETIAGLSETFAARDMQFILHILQPGEDPVPVHRKLMQAGLIDGFVLTSIRTEDSRIAFLQAQGVPFVTHGRAAGPVDYAFFDIDNRQLARDSADALIARGHRRIALINGLGDGPEGQAFAQERKQGYLAALAAVGIPESEAIVLNGPMTRAFGQEAVTRLWSRGRPPSALICASILSAGGVYEALAERGLTIPGDVSVIAHDDDLPGQDSAGFSPPLSVTWAPLNDSWQPLARLLSDCIEGKPVQRLQVLSPHKLILRDSISTR